LARFSLRVVIESKGEMEISLRTGVVLAWQRLFTAVLGASLAA
jgi:hypothetical protein